MAPTEIKGSAGAIPQISVTFGSLFPFAISLIWNRIQKVDDMTDDELYVFIVAIFGIPIVFSLIQICLLCCVFRYDTPVFMKQKGQHAKIKELFLKIYDSKHIVDLKIEEI